MEAALGASLSALPITMVTELPSKQVTPRRGVSDVT
jgi:hypothetical protein